MESNGLQIMILLRLSPLIPYNVLDYMSGTTSIPISSYICSMSGMIPVVILYTFVGTTASNIIDSSVATNETKSIANLISLIFGVLFAILGVFVASYYSKKELYKVKHCVTSLASSMQTFYTKRTILFLDLLYFTDIALGLFSVDYGRKKNDTHEGHAYSSFLETSVNEEY